MDRCLGALIQDLSTYSHLGRRLADASRSFDEFGLRLIKDAAASAKSES